MDIKNLSDLIVAEINRNLEAIRWSKAEIHDKYAVGNAKMLIDLLDGIDEVKSEKEFLEKLQMMRLSVSGAADTLDHWIDKLKNS